MMLERWNRVGVCGLVMLMHPELIGGVFEKVEYRYMPFETSSLYGVLRVL